MELSEAIQLIDTPEIRGKNPKIWADLGAGSGLFSFALAEFLPSGSVVYAVEKNIVPLMKAKSSNNVAVQPIRKNFAEEDLEVELLDGIIAANALHFIDDKAACIERLMRQMKPAAPILIVEYDLYDASRWVPYPLPATGLVDLFSPFKYYSVKKISERRSVFNRSKIYSALITP